MGPVPNQNVSRASQHANKEAPGGGGPACLPETGRYIHIYIFLRTVRYPISAKEEEEEEEEEEENFPCLSETYVCMYVCI